jgi:hypothetical protein
MWTYLGEVSSTVSNSETVGAVANAAGWVVASERDRTATTWIVEIPWPLQQVDLLCSAADSRLLVACARAGLRCWAVGTQLVAAHLRFVVLQRLAVWHVRDESGRLPTVPARVGAALCASAAAEAFAVGWSGLSPGGSSSARRRPYLAHPLVHGKLGFIEESLADCWEESVEFRTDVLGGVLFLTQQEEGAANGSNPVYCPPAARLGSSPLHYVFPPVFGTPGTVVANIAAHDIRRAAPGALVLGERPSALLRISASLCAVDVLSQSGTTTLVVAPRQVFPSASRILEAGLPPGRFQAVATLKDVRGIAALPQVVLASLEVTQAHNPFGPRDRLVLLGWPQVADVLRRSRIFPKARFTVALGLASEADSLMLPERHAGLRGERLAQLFSVPPAVAAEAGTLQQLLESRLMRLDPPSHAGEVAYSVLEAPPLSDTESKRAAGLVEPARSRAMLLGPLYGPSGPFPWIPDGGGADAVDAYFTRSSPTKAKRAAAFARASYGREPPRDGCPICFDPAPTTVTLCGHWFCGDCLLPALETAPACPLCKSPTDLRCDVVSVGRPVPPPDRTAYLDYLGQELARAPPKSVVVCSHGELHEKLACALRSRGVRAVAWAGNARQVALNSDAFCREGTRCCLLVDPPTLSAAWLAPPPVGRVYVLAPLLSLKRSYCCQLRETLSVFRGDDGLAAPLTFVCRSLEHLPGGQALPAGCARPGGCLQLLRPS